MDNSEKLSSNRSFLSFFSVKLLGAFNDSFIQAGFLAFVTYALLNTPEDSQTLVYLASGLFMIPVFLFSALAGELSDKYDKAALLRKVKIFEICIAVIMAVSFTISSSRGMLLGMFLAGVEASFFTPIRLSIVPFITGQDKLIVANSALESGSYVAKFAGTIAGIVAGASINIYFPILLLVLSTLGYLASRRIAPQEPADSQTVVHKMFLASTWSNLRYARHSRQVYLSLIGLAGAWCVTVTFMIQLSQIANNIFEGGFGNEVLSPLFLGPFCLGIGAGAAVASKVYKKEPINAFLPLSAVIEAGLMIYFTASMFLHTPLTYHSTELHGFSQYMEFIRFYLSTFSGMNLVVTVFLITFFAAMFIVPVTSYLQKSSPDEIRTRIMSANNITAALFSVISSVTGIALTAVFGAQLGLGLMSAAIALVCLAGAIITVGILPVPMLRALVRKGLELIYHTRCEGLENFRSREGKRTLIIANHTSFLDGVLLWTYLHDNISYAVDTGIANKWYFRLMLSLAKYYPIDSTNPMAIRSLIKEIDNGRIPAIFPEGRITTTGTLMKIYSGTAVIADKADAEILPVIIEGSQYSSFSYFGSKFRHRPRSRIYIRVMPAVKFSVPSEYTGKARSRKAADMMYAMMAKLKVEASIMPDNTLFGSFIDTCKSLCFKKKILEDHGRKQLSSRSVLVKSMALGRYFKKHETDTHIGLLLPNSSAAVVTFLALQACGKIPCMLNFSTGARNLLACSDAVPLKTVYTSRTFIEKGGFGHLTSALSEHGVNVKYLEDLASEIGPATRIAALLSLLRPYKSYRKLCDGHTDSNSPAVVLFTSGSEGLPKGVVLSHRNIETNIVQLQAVLPFSMLDSVFNSMPMFHSFGLTAGTLLPLITGMKVFMYPSPLHYKNVPLLVYDTNSTAIFGTDTFLRGYAEYAHPYDMYAVKFVVSGGEKLKEETVNMWNDKFGIRILEGYGATETSPVISVNTSMYYRRNTAGCALPGIETKLEQIPGITEGGRLWVRGDNVMLGYIRADNPGVIDPPQDKWYDTGDIASIDEQNFIHILGRAKRFAKIAGEMISLTQVETALSTLYPDNALAVVSVPDAKKGEQLMLFIAGAEADRRQLAEFFKKQGISELAVPKYIQSVENIPLNGTGKIDYLKVKSEALKIIGA